MVICYGLKAEEAWLPFASQKEELIEYWDAGEKPNLEYRMSILNCLRGLEKAIVLGWYKFQTFKYKQYEHNYSMEGGDMNWIIPDKILAFSSPEDSNKSKALPSKIYIPKFRPLKIKAIIRLNEPLYDDLTFKSQGINVYDLEFLDGSCPDDDIIKEFITIVNQEIKHGGGIAVHCRAGLGRTGTLIGCYIMNKYAFEPNALIGWLRLARPGSVIGI